MCLTAKQEVFNFELLKKRLDIEKLGGVIVHTGRDL